MVIPHSHVDNKQRALLSRLVKRIEMRIMRWKMEKIWRLHRDRSVLKINLNEMYEGSITPEHGHHQPQQIHDKLAEF